MRQPRLVSPFLLATLLAVSACVGQPTSPAGSRVAVSRAPRPTALPTSPTTSLTASAALRRIETGILRDLSGKVKLVSDQGGSLISDQGGALISDQGGAIISPESGRILSNNSGTMLGKTKFYGLRQAGRLKEDLLADAVVEVLDAAGRVLADKTGQPLRATSDAEGRYRLQAALPDENVVLRVRLNPKLAGEDAELRALVANKGAGGPAAVDLDTSASLAAAYVLGEYVKREQAVLDRLPAKENLALRREVEQARALLPQEVPAYQPDRLAAAVAKLRAQAKPLDETLARIKAILLVGQANLGQGLQATQVPLSLPVAVARDAAGNTYIAESVAGRIRKVTPEGAISVLAGDDLTGTVRDGIAASEATFETISDLAAEPDGSLLVVERGAHRLVRLTAQGKVQLVAGTGAASQAGEGGPATQAGLAGPTAVAVGSDGTIYLSEEAVSKDFTPRLLALGKDGVLRRVATGPSGGFAGVAVTADGALWVATTGDEGQVLRLPAGASEPAPVGIPLNLGFNARLLPTSGNGVYVTESGGDRVLQLAPDGTVSKLTGPGQPGEGRDESLVFQSLEAEAALLRRPYGLASLPDGRLLVVDSGHMLVRVLDPTQPEAPLAPFAGAVGVQTTGAAQAIGVNAPAGLTVAPDGRRLVFAEAGAGVIKQLAGGQVSVLAGGRTAPWTDGGPAVTAGLTSPAAVAYDRAGNLWIADSTHPRILKVTPTGAMFHVAGTGRSAPVSGETLTFDPAGKPAREVQLGRPVALAIGPDDLPYWTDQGFNVVCRLTADDRVEVVVGQAPARYAEGGDAGDEGLASAARLNFPTGLAFDQAGRMYLTDALNFKLRRVDVAAQPPTIQTIGGLGLAGTLLALAEGPPTSTQGQPLAGQPLVAPAGLFVDAKDRLYLVEGGTVRLTSLLKLPPGLPLVPTRIRRIDLTAPDMPVTTIAGPGGRVLTETRGDQVLGLPLGLAVDADGHLIIADGLNNQIKRVPDAVLD
ncbi:MAG: hypothetical protein VKQ33_15080 [Candidatus Sericytochromatia bacterium]|nr:hypothetical protein [Candidatus Sericytochromatia bacterium]